jgi:sialate O-acetylesterase
MANVTLPSIFSSNMVLQQKTEVKIWGWAKPGETIKLTTGWMEDVLETKTDNQGTWSLMLATPNAGGPYAIELNGHNKIVLNDVLIGEVWICSGQSNMEWSANSGIDNAAEEIAAANFPNIRLFTVSNSTAKYPQNNCMGIWDKCTPETMQNFSAIGYFFAHNLQQILDIPIGIINSSWGGTPAEAWMPERVFEVDTFLLNAANKQKPVPWGPVETARIHNAMIAPLVPFKIAGALWYQGEQNTINGYAYKELLTELIKAWREDWSQNFPFYFAQIAPYKYGNNFNGVIVRNEQRQVLELENTGMVVTSDIGDTTNIHPKNKQSVALRFANMALNRHYKSLEIEDAGPLFKSALFQNNRAVILFKNAKGLHTKGEKLNYFELAGDDGKFFPAQAKIIGETVVLESDKVKEPTKARFAWRNTATPNLYNAAGLPTSCFITE